MRHHGGTGTSPPVIYTSSSAYHDLFHKNMYACEYASVSLKKDSRLKTRTVGYYFDETKNIYLTFILLVSSVILIKSQYSIKILFFDLFYW